MMSGTDRARSRCARARNSRTPPATVANRRPGNRGPPVRNDPRAAPIAPNAAEPEKAAIKLVSQAWARIALAFRRCGLEDGTSAVGAAVGGDSRASMTDSGADASTNANDMAVNAAPIACSEMAVIVATMAAVAPVTAAAAANSAFGAPGPPGTASRPASAAKLVASVPNVRPIDCSRETRYAIAAASNDNRAVVTATPAQPVRWASFARNTARVSIVAATPASHVVASEPTNRALRRVQHDSITETDADTASASSSKRGTINSVAELVRSKAAPSRIPNWASVFDGSNAALPGRES